ncbi:MAG: hypothetical protein EBU90_23470, partial [Proteobacteria bacterium]|nr:hypothetical protein [Pseudomonadota bacterium]
MLIYSHCTPEILIASFRTKQQVKNSSYCNLVDDNLPDDVSALKGDSLIIKEGTNTLNIDIALALAFNAIRSPESAKQFGKILIANGTNVDTRTLMFYVRRIKNSPFGSTVQKYFNDHFDYINNNFKGNAIAFQNTLGGLSIVNTNQNIGSGTGSPNTGVGIVNGGIGGTNNNNQGGVNGLNGIGTNNNNNIVNLSDPNSELYDGLGVESTKPFSITRDPIDTDFINTLKKLAKDCLTSPCNYFDHGGSFGFLSNSAQMLTPFTTINSDLTNDSIGVGIHDQETFTRMPPIFQRIATKLNQVTTTTVNKMVQNFNNAISRSLSGGNVLTSDTNTFEQYSKAQSNILTNLAENLGDCFRMDDFRRRYNPFNYYEQGGANGEQAAPPGISGMPVGYKNVKNDSLHSSLSGTPKSFVTNNTWYCPGGGTSAKEKALEGGVQDRRGRPAYTYEAAMAGSAPYVTVAMDSSVLPYGTLLYNENFKRSDGTLLPFKVTDTGGAFAGKGFTKMDIATSSIQKARGGP